jgi:hypothetical protein
MEFEDQAAPWRGLYQYWRDKHVDGRPPSRGDIDPPLEIPRLIKHLMIVDIRDGAFKFRLIGSELSPYVKTDDAGDVTWAKVWDTQDVLRTWIALMNQVKETQRPQLVVSRFPTGVKAYSHSLVLPLVARSGQTELLLVGAFPGGYIDPNVQVEGLETQEVVRPEDGDL